jgi:hypothetical protein
MADTTDSQCQHEHVEVRLRCPDCGQDFDSQRISRAELDAQSIELPDREAMSLLGSGLLSGGFPIPGAASPTDAGALPTTGPAPGGSGLTGGVDPMGLIGNLTPDTSDAATGPYAPETSSSSQT